jgi:hypothetical protein
MVDVIAMAHLQMPVVALLRTMEEEAAVQTVAL